MSNDCIRRILPRDADPFSATSPELYLVLSLGWGRTFTSPTHTIVSMHTDVFAAFCAAARAYDSGWDAAPSGSPFPKLKKVHYDATQPEDMIVEDSGVHQWTIREAENCEKLQKKVFNPRVRTQEGVQKGMVRFSGKNKDGDVWVVWVAKKGVLAADAEDEEAIGAAAEDLGRMSENRVAHESSSGYDDASGEMDTAGYGFAESHHGNNDRLISSLQAYADSVRPAPGLGSRLNSDEMQEIDVELEDTTQLEAAYDSFRVI